MNLATEFLTRGKEISLERAGKCMWCGDTGFSTVGYPGLERIDNGIWACTCEKGTAVLADARRNLRQKLASSMLAQAEIPRHYVDYTLETFRQVSIKSMERLKALRMVNEWLTKPQRPWLFLYGKTGRGKTGLGVAALKALLEQGRIGKFVASFDMFSELKARFGGDVESYIDALAKIDVLMLDEIVPIQITDWRIGVLFELIWRRDAQQVTTIITTAAGPDLLDKSVTEAGHRRIRENSLLVELGGNEINYGR